MWRRKVAIIRDEQLKQTIKDSIQAEKDAMDFYLLAATKVYNERTRLTFKLLAREEREHALSFYDIYNWDDLPPFDTLMAVPPAANSIWLKELNEIMLGDFNEEQALALAIQRERALEKGLLTLAEHIEDEAVREVYLKNAHMTHRHIEVITKDYNLAHLEE